VPLVPTGGDATARARLRIRSAGSHRLRLVAAGAAPSPAVTVRVTRPARRHVPVGPAPSRIVVGAGGVWVLGQDAGGATVRRLDPRTGAVRRTFPVGGTASGLAAGAGAVWVVRGSDLLRLDPATGAVTASSRICGIHGSVVAGREGVWTAGGCDPDAPGLTGFPFVYSGVALRIDPASATPVGAPLTIPGADVFGGALAGGVLWLFGGDAPRDGATVASFDVATGAPRAAQGSTPAGTVVPVDAARVWVAKAGRIEQALPRARTIARAPHGVWTLAPPAGRVWALASVLARNGTTARTLTSFSKAGRRGAARIIGVSPKTPDPTVAPVLAVGLGAVWILLPDEGAVVRVPLR
jgi:hypothetical protein